MVERIKSGAVPKPAREGFHIIVALFGDKYNVASRNITTLTKSHQFFPVAFTEANN